MPLTSLLLLVSYPSYSRLDDYILFDAVSNGDEIVGLLPMNADKVSPADNAFGFVYGLWANWFGTANRALKNEEQLAETNMTIYPNPTSDILNIVLQPESLGETIWVKLYANDGKIVINQFVQNTQNMTVDVSHLPTGNYQVVISDGAKFVAQSIVVSRN